MEGSIQKVFDTRGALRCVRFESGNVGVVTTQGKTKLVVGPFQELSFAENGFLRVFNRRSSESHQARLGYPESSMRKAKPGAGSSSST